MSFELRDDTRRALALHLLFAPRRATNFFSVPPDRVVEIGIQLEI